MPEPGTYIAKFRVFETFWFDLDMVPETSPVQTSFVDEFVNEEIHLGQRYDAAWATFQRLFDERRNELQLQELIPLQRVIRVEPGPPQRRVPCVLLRGFQNAKQVEKWHATLSKPEHQRHYDPLTLLYEITRARFAYHANIEARLVAPTPTYTLCGSLAIVGQGERRRTVTIGGVLQIGDVLWASTAAHFFTEGGYIKPEEDGPKHILDTGTSTIAKLFTASHYDDRGEAPVDSWRADAAAVADFDTHRLLGGTEVFGDSDWCLIPIQDRALALPNFLRIPGNSLFFSPPGERLSLEEVAKKPGDREVRVLAGASGRPLPATMAPGQVEVPLPSGKWLTAWECVLKKGSGLIRGDSGSWIVDAKTGAVFGQVVATLGESVFMLPMVTLIKEVEAGSGAHGKVSLPSSRALLTGLVQYHRDVRHDARMAQLYESAYTEGKYSSKEDEKALRTASAKGDISTVRRLLEEGVDVNARPTPKVNSPFTSRSGIYRSRNKAVTDNEGESYYAAPNFFSRSDSRVGGSRNRAITDDEGELYDTALQAATVGGYETIVRLLLEKGADANAKGSNQSNPLYSAVSSGHESIIRLLLDHGADPNARHRNEGSALYEASSHGYEPIVRLLLQKGADANAQGGYHGTALCVASLEGHELIVRSLLENGADINAQGRLYSSALCAASACNKNEIIRLLLDKGADINATDGQHGTALYEASTKGFKVTVWLLLECGADVNIKSGQHGTALQAARVKGDEEIVQLLLEKGADDTA